MPEGSGIAFECELDGDGSFSGPQTTSCDSGSKSYASLADGTHIFRVRAVGTGGPDPTPASRSWTVDTVAPQTTILSSPPEPSSGFEARFTFASSESSSSFRCQLDSGVVQTCVEAGKSYFALTEGPHVFRVWAIDNAGNKDATPAERAFTVSTVLGDLTPPDTAIVAAPPDPSPTATASFAYSSSEPSSFECSLDGSAFASCPASGIAYADLVNGSHSFAVRATDAAGNVDSIPATYAWWVAASVPDTRIVGSPGGAVRSRDGAAVAVSFRFASSESQSRFQCRLDLEGPYVPCSSPYRVKAKPGRHVFEVFAIDRLGNEEGSPAFRIFRVVGPGARRAFFSRSGRLLSSLTASVAPHTLPRRGRRPVSLSFASTFENLDGSDVPPLKSMTLRLANGGALNASGLPRCTRPRLAQRTTASARAACHASLVGRGTVSTALRFPEGRRLRSQAQLLLFNARGGILMHVYATEPLEGTFVVFLRVGRRPDGGIVLSARFPRIAAGYGHLTGFRMRIGRIYRRRGDRRGFLVAGCPAPHGLNRVAFELAKVEYRFEGGLRVRNSTINVCRAG